MPARASAILPVNTRTIGTPEGIYILYLEDYVHTFLKKVLTEKEEKCVHGRNSGQHAAGHCAVWALRGRAWQISDCCVRGSAFTGKHE